MLLVGSDDGVYRIDGFDEADSASATRLLGTGRAMRLRQFDGLPGVFAATEDGLFRSIDGSDWTDLGVPETKVYAVGASPAGTRLYAGTRPAAMYVADVPASSRGDGDGDDARGLGDLDWTECEAFQELPSRDEWRLPRHENLAQVRDVSADPGGADRLVAGVEVGGVHVSDDGGETWVERADGVHDDVHELHVVSDGSYVAATGFGLYRTDDAGRSWERLDGDVPQRYFRSAFSIDGTVYASANLANSSTWDDEDADPALYRVDGDGRLIEIAVPSAAGTVAGMTAVDGDLAVATHRGSLFGERDGALVERGRFPVPGDVVGSYTPLSWLVP